MSRPLLPLPNQLAVPAQDPAGAANASQLPPPNPPDPPPPPNPKVTYAKRGKITIVACVPCRRRKTKRPACSQCQSRDGQCHYDMTDQERRLTYLRDNVEHLAEEKATLESLISALQTGSENDAAEIMRRLRAGTDVQTLAQQVHAVQLLAGVRGEGVTQGESLSPTDKGEGIISSHLSTHSFSPRSAPKFEALVQTISLASPAEADEIVRRLRSRDDAASVLSAAQAGTLLLPLPARGPSESRGIEGEYSQKEQTFGLVKGSMSDSIGTSSSQPRPSFVAHTLPSGKPSWTTVTTDSAFIEHLHALYFCWQHPFFQSFPEQDFREDMDAGRTRFCSRLLVNAVCAAGCMFSDRPGARQKALEFFDEAASLLHRVEVPSITSVAAAYLLCHVKAAQGQLSALWNYSGQSGRMALDINLHLRGERTSDSDMEAKPEERARLHTFWGCFIADQIVSFTLGRLPQLQTSAITLDLPSVRPEDDVKPWLPYGATGPGPPSAVSTFFHEMAALSKIVNSTLHMFFAPTRIMSGGLYLAEYQKYTDWYKRLPAVLAETEDASPHVLSLHMYYQAAVLLLFRPLLRAQFTNSTTDPRAVCRSSACAISELFAQHKRSYGINGIHTFQINCLLAACSIHLINLPALSATKHLTDACNAFHDLVKLNAWAIGSLNVLRELVGKWHLILPMEVEAALHRNGDVPLDKFNFSLLPVPSGSSSNLAEIAETLKRAGSTPSPQETTKKKRPRTGSKEKHEPPIMYLFAPFPNQPPPLLGPTHTSTSAETELTDELSRIAQDFDGLDFTSDPYMGWPRGIESEQEYAWD